MRPHGITGDEITGSVRHLEVRVRIDLPFAIVERLDAGEIARLTDRGDDQIAGDIELGALLDDHALVRPLHRHHAQRPGAAVRAEDDLHRRQAPLDLDAFSQRGLHLVAGRTHLLDGAPIHEPDLGALAPRGRGHVMGGMA